MAPTVIESKNMIGLRSVTLLVEAGTIFQIQTVLVRRVA